MAAAAAGGAVIILKSSIIVFVLLFLFALLYLKKRVLTAGQNTLLSAAVILSFLYCLREPPMEKYCFPIKPEIVCSAMVTTLGDSAMTGTGSRMKIKITSLTTWSGAVFSADCEMMLILSSREQLYLGAELKIHNLTVSPQKGIIRAARQNREVAYNNDLWRLRARIRKGLDRTLPAGNEYALVKALLLGDRNGLEPGLPALFRRAGISHILALSGMHLHLICSVFLALFSRFFRRKTVFVLMCPLVLFYLYLAGPLPSLIRGALFWFLSGTAGSFGINRRHEISFVLTVFFSLALFPELAVSLSFLFSCSAVAGILFLSKPLAFFLQKYLPPFISSPLSAGTGAWLATLPLQVFYWQQTVPGGIILTIIISPLVFLYMCAGGVALVCSGLFIYPLQKVIDELVRVLYTVIALVCRTGAVSSPLRLPALLVYAYIPGLLCITVVYIIYTERNRRHLGKLQFHSGNKKTA